MSTHRRQKVTAAYGTVNEMRPPLQEWVNGQTASESAFDTENRQDAIAHSLEPSPRNALASKVE